MPYRSEKVKIAGTKHDRRRRLSDEQKKAIVILSREGYSQRKLAAMFGCSKGSIQFILNPGAKSKPKSRSSAYWSAAKKKYRRRKQELYKTGKINERKKKRGTNDRAS